jgi:hypothetical protein
MTGLAEDGVLPSAFPEQNRLEDAIQEYHQASGEPAMGMPQRARSFSIEADSMLPRVINFGTQVRWDEELGDLAP